MTEMLLVQIRADLILYFPASDSIPLLECLLFIRAFILRILDKVRYNHFYLEQYPLSISDQSALVH